MTATRLLIAEDKIVVANNLQDRLQAMGYSVVDIVSSGKEAIQLTKELRPDIVLMDIKLQGEVDGIQAAQEIRASCDVPIIYLTGHADEATLQRARLTEPYGYLLKPFDVLELHTTIEMALYRHAAERRVRESEEQYRDELERRVEERTADLARTNLLLKEEVGQRQQVEETLRRRNRELALLNRIISATANGQDVSTILQTVCRELARALDLAHAAAALTDEKMVQATVVAEFSTGSGQLPFLGRTIAVEDSPALIQALQQETPLVVDLAKNDPQLAPFQELVCDGRRVSLLILPLFTEGALVGGLGLCARESEPFSDEEVDLARRVAEQVSGSLARVRLAEMQHRLSTAIEQTADAILILDAEDSILYVNPAFERATGYSRVEALGQTPGFFKSDWHEEAFYQRLRETIAAGQVWQGRLINRRKDGTLFPTDATITPLRNPAGEIVNVVATLRDATREAQLEDQVRHVQKMEAVGQLAGALAHDFNNLLTVIHMSSTVLQRQMHLKDPLLEHVVHIQSATRRAANLTAQLLSFSRREVGKQQVLDLNQIIDDLDWMLQRLVGNDIKVVRSLARDLRPVQAVPSQLEQVLVNLVVNARDAMPRGGTLTIETANVVLGEVHAAGHPEAQPGAHVVLTVSDTGIGMDDEIKAHIFEPFFTTKKRGEGTGLGLTTVFGIVKHSGGHILVESSVGQGTIFQIFLPSVDGVAPSAEPEQAVVSERAGAGQTILVVEDEELVRDLVARILRSQGYQIHLAGSGLEALQVSEQCSGDVDLLLADLKMPEMNGLEVATRLRSRWPQMRVLYMSGYGKDVALVRQALDEGTAFLPKPFDLDTLMEKIRAVLDDEH